MGSIVSDLGAFLRIRSNWSAHNVQTYQTTQLADFLLVDDTALPMV